MYSENIRKRKDVMNVQFKNEPLICNFEFFQKKKNPLFFASFGENAHLHFIYICESWEWIW